MNNIRENKGYFKVYWTILDDDDLDYQAAFFLGYLTDVFSYLKNSAVVDGKTYKRLSTSFIQEKIPVTNNTINKWIKQLEDCGYIEIYHKDNMKKGNRYYRLNDSYYECYKDSNYDRSNECSNNRNQNLTTNKPNQPTQPTQPDNPDNPKEDSYVPEIREVISYLNQKTGKRFRCNESNSEHIRARLAEGYTVEDCKKVIDNKSLDEWFVQNNRLDCQTPFKSEFFDKYLNEIPKKPVSIEDMMFRDSRHNNRLTPKPEYEHLFKFNTCTWEYTYIGGDK